MPSLYDFPSGERVEATTAGTPMQDASQKLYSDLDLSGEKIREVMLRNFKAIDTDKDDRLSKKEIEAFKPADEDALAHHYVKSRVREIAGIQKESFFPSAKITRGDLNQLAIKESPKLGQIAKRYDEYSQVFVDNFKKIDTDRSKSVSKEELDIALTNPDLDAGAKQTVRFFRDHYEANTMALNPAFNWNAELDEDRIKETKNIFDFTSVWSSPWNRFALPTGGALLGAGTAAFTLWRSSTISSILGSQAAKPSWQTYAIAAGVGAVVGGGYLFATALGQDKTIPKSRLALFNALSAEMDQATASPLESSPASAEKVRQRELAERQLEERWGPRKPAQPAEPPVVTKRPIEPEKPTEPWTPPSSGMGGKSTRTLLQIK